jgi:hypothetical protein
MDNDDQNKSGTGGGLRYRSEETTFDMVGQERLYSCQVACVRQLLRDAGLELTEQELLTEIGYFEGWGTTSADAAVVLDRLHPTLGFVGGAVDPDGLQVLFSISPWIASMRTDRGTIHAVIVDKLVGHVVTVRDPWGAQGLGSANGVRATIELADFQDHWHWAINNAIFSNRTKRK